MVKDIIHFFLYIYWLFVDFTIGNGQKHSNEMLSRVSKYKNAAMHFAEKKKCVKKLYSGML